MWARALLLITLAVTWVSAEKTFYGDANRSLYNSPKSRAMGGADLASSTEGLPSGSPAGIVNSGGNSVYIGYAGFYQNLFGATTASMNMAFDTVQSVGISLSYLMIPDVDSVSIVDHGDGTPQSVTITAKTASELYLNFLYGRKLLTFSRGELIAGGALHVKRLRLIDWTGYGVGADLAVHCNFNVGVSLALKMENFFTEYTHWSDSYSENGLPRFYFGAAFTRDLTNKVGVSLAYKSPDLFGNSGVGGGSFTVDGQFEEGPEKVSVRSNPAAMFTYANYGAEVLLRKIVALRAGFTDTRMLNFGGGVHLFERWDIDFVYSHTNALEGSYSLSTRFYF